MGQETEIFSNRDLKNMILPLFLEQLLVMLVGMVDTFVVSYAGEAAVSGVALVNQFNTIFIYLFTALASGGAVVICQYIGRKAMDNAGESASQLLLFSTVFSVIISALVLLGGEWLLRLLFGRVEPDVMAACVTYLRISAYSYPALAVYNSGAAIYRSLGKTDVTMYLSVVSNIINIIGNIIGVFVLHAGVAGVAWPSLIARIFSAVVITVLCYRKQNGVVYRRQWIFRWNGASMTHFGYCRTKRSGEWRFSACKGGSIQYCGPVWHLSDRRKRCGAEHLVDGSSGGSCHGSDLYHSDRTMYGKWRLGRCRLLFQKADLYYASAVIRMEFSDLSADAAVSHGLRIGAKNKAACYLAGIDPQRI